ncbi:unnamed protein product [Effrenium voratum]|nr:unnamed protein product [Effrenium voratum]
MGVSQALRSKPPNGEADFGRSSSDLIKFQEPRQPMSSIRKVSTQDVHDAVHIRKHMMNGQEDESCLASDKMRMLKTGRTI